MCGTISGLFSRSPPFLLLQANRTPKLSVVVVNWNGRRWIRRCLQHLQTQDFRDFETLVVDNGSDDGSLEIISNEYPEVKLLARRENIGFAAANNYAAKIARSEWLVLLNNDAFPDRCWLLNLTDAAEKNPQFAGFASCQLLHDDPTQLDGAGDTYHCAGIAWRAGHRQPYGSPWDQPREIFGPCAAAAMYRRREFLACGGFDEDYFCYFEDVDLAFRMQLQGNRFFYVPHAKVRHVGSASHGHVSALARYHGHRNMVWTFLKNMPPPLFWRYLPLHIAVLLAALIRSTVCLRPGPTWRGKRDALRGLRSILDKRRAVQASRRVSAHTLDGRMAHGLLSLWQRGQGTDGLDHHR